MKKQNGQNKEMQKKFYIKTGVAVGLSILATFCMLIIAIPFMFPISQKEEIIVVELGNEPDSNVKNYVTGLAPAMWVSKIDYSEVDYMKVGEYKATIKHCFQTLHYTVLVEDTVAPELTLIEDDIYIQADVEYPASYFVEEAFDASGDVELTVEEKGGSENAKDNIVLSERGEYKLVVYATDGEENTKSETIKINVDTSPELCEVKDYYVVAGSEIDFMEGVTAVDEEDGDVTSDIEVDNANIDLDTEGVYEVVYSVSDSRGFVTQTNVSVNVMPADDIQELINTREIDRNEDTIMGAYNLYDRGYYTDIEMEDVLEEVLPCIVRVRVPGLGVGSGFIIQITEDELIVCTNQHVVGDNEKVEIHFFDGTELEGRVAYANYVDDIAFVTIARNHVPEDLMEQVYTVHINKEYWDELDNTAEIDVGTRTIKEDGKLWQDQTGELVYKETESLVNMNGRNTTVCETTSVNYPGSSGSAVFDSEGNLIAMVSGYTSGWVGVHYYNVTLDNICLNFYEAFGREVYYY